MLYYYYNNESYGCLALSWLQRSLALVLEAVRPRLAARQPQSHYCEKAVQATEKEGKHTIIIIFPDLSGFFPRKYCCCSEENVISAKTDEVIIGANFKFGKSDEEDDDGAVLFHLFPLLRILLGH